MKPKHFFLSALAMLLVVGTQAQIYMGKTCEITFFSAAALENITAVNKSTKPILNSATGDVLVKVTITGFTFEKALMQEHFNENYMESEKYPQATFKGKINEKVDYTKDGSYKVTITGKLNIHGVEKDRTIEAVIQVKGGVVIVDSVFKVSLKDHNITVPELLFQKIAETVDVKLHTEMVASTK
jgi:polyisoprenoid-binding protein YceI